MEASIQGSKMKRMPGFHAAGLEELAVGGIFAGDVEALEEITGVGVEAEVFPRDVFGVEAGRVGDGVLGGESGGGVGVAIRSG